MDRPLFRAIDGWSEALNPVLTDFSVAHDWAYFRLTMVAVVLALAIFGKGRAALLSLVAFPHADALCNLAKRVAPMPRPFQTLPHVMMRVGFSDPMGTASSHAAKPRGGGDGDDARGRWRWGAPRIAVAFLVGLSRVSVDAHFPSQVVMGWLIGVSVGLGVGHGAGTLTRAFLARRTRSV